MIKWVKIRSENHLLNRTWFVSYRISVKLCLTCLSVCVTEPAVCGNEEIGCYEPVYNFIQILDLLKPNFERSYGRRRRKWGNSPNFPGRISREWFELQRRNSGCWSTPSILTVFFRCFRRGMVERSHPQFSEIRCWANGVQLQGPPKTINLIFSRNVEENERKWRSRNFKFRISADPLPSPANYL